MTVTINGTTGIAGVDGSAATPAVQGVDTNTGVFYGTDIVGISTGGTERMRVASAGQVGIGGANYGTSGQVLTSGGAAAAPSWTTVSTTGRLLQAPQILTSGTSYTTPAGCTAIYVEAVGGGGGGGGADSGGTTNGAGCGGGAGAYAAKYFTVTASNSYAYAIGAGGTASAPTGAGSGGDGGTGGSTTFTVGATVLTSGGGGGGVKGFNGPGLTQGAGGSASNGDLNIRGASGFLAHQSDLTEATIVSGAGGNAFLGGGGAEIRSASASAGEAGVFGSGGSGAATDNSTGLAGGVGGTGFIRITEYS